MKYTYMPEVGQLLNMVAKTINLKAYPLVADSGAGYPFIQYRRASQTIGTTKDGGDENVANYEVVIACQNYAQSVELLHKYIDALYAMTDEDWFARRAHDLAIYAKSLPDPEEEEEEEEPTDEPTEGEDEPTEGETETPTEPSGKATPEPDPEPDPEPEPEPDPEPDEDEDEELEDPIPPYDPLLQHIVIENVVVNDGGESYDYEAGAFVQQFNVDITYVISDKYFS